MIFLIPAAGKGTRAGLPYPKCLHEYNGTEIIISNLNKINSVGIQNKVKYQVVILITREALSVFSLVINKYLFSNLEIHFGQQLEAKGTASAVLDSFLTLETKCMDRFSIIWGDCIGYKLETLKKMVDDRSHDILIPGLHMEKCYTEFVVDSSFNVLSCRETKGLKVLPAGYTDIGLFTFNSANLLSDCLREFIENLKHNRENSFIEFISYCCNKNKRVKFLDCCTKNEKKGFNSLEDLYD